MRYRVGTIGFSYADWKPGFYPSGTRVGDFLAAYAKVFDNADKRYASLLDTIIAELKKTP